MSQATLLYFLFLNLALYGFSNVDANSEGVGRLITLDEKWELLRSKPGVDDSLSPGQFPLIQLNSQELSILMSFPRNYTVITLMNVQSKDHPCPACDEAQENIEIFRKIYQGANPDASVLFTWVNFVDQGREAFQGIAIQNPPSCLAVEKDAKSPYKIENVDFANLKAFLEIRLRTTIHTQSSFHWKRFLLLLSLVVVVVGLVGLFWRPWWHFIRHPLLWRILLLVFITVWMGGYWWVSIRKPPFFGRDESGRSSPLAFLLPQFQAQLGSEIYLMAGVYGMCSLVFTMLVTVVPRIDDPAVQNYAALGLAFTWGFLFSMGCLFFRQKGTGYPFGLFF